MKSLLGSGAECLYNAVRIYSHAAFRIVWLSPALSWLGMPDACLFMNLSRRHLTRLRQMYRSSGWPCQDTLEVDLIAAGLLSLHWDADGRSTIRLTAAGIDSLAAYGADNREARSAHEQLVEQVAQHQHAQGRIAWRGLSLRASIVRDAVGRLAVEEAPDDPEHLELPELLCVPDDVIAPAAREWVVAMPDVFSLRHTSREAYLEPVIHEIKVSRADLLGDLRKASKRAAYLAMAPRLYYVLGRTSAGKPIATPEEIPDECGVMGLDAQNHLVCLREAPQRPFVRLRFDVWMALARATPVSSAESGAQQSF